MTRTVILHPQRSGVEATPVFRRALVGRKPKSQVEVHFGKAHLTYRALVRQIRRVLPVAAHLTPSASGKRSLLRPFARYRYSTKKRNLVFLEGFETCLRRIRGVMAKVSA